MKTTRNRRMKEARRLTLPGLAMTAAASLALALGLSACENVATYTQPSLVRVIDASYIAPAVNVEVEDDSDCRQYRPGNHHSLWHASGLQQRLYPGDRGHRRRRPGHLQRHAASPAISTLFFSPTTARLPPVMRLRFLRTSRFRPPPATRPSASSIRRPRPAPWTCI